MDIKEINRNIVSIAKTTTNVQDKIQSTLVGCIVHALGKGNGDHTQFTRLVNAMSSGMRRPDSFTGNYNALQERVLKALKALNQV